MNSPKQNAYAPNQPRDAASAEETLRLIAGLPATEGLEERLKAGLKAAPKKGRVLAWADPSKSGGGWMRSTAVRAAAAAAIVCVVAGGGWSVYSRVQPAQMPKVIAMPQRVAAPGGFSSAGAMRTPQTLNGSVLAHPVIAMPKQDGDGKKLTAKTKKSRPAKPSPAGLRPMVTTAH